MKVETSIGFLTLCALIISIAIAIRLIFPTTYCPAPCGPLDKITTINRYTGEVIVQHPKHYVNGSTID